MNEFPPQQGAALLTPAFGALPSTTDATSDVTLVSLAHSARPMQVAGDYRVLGVYPVTPGPLGSPTLALGSARSRADAATAPGDIVTLVADTDPPLGQIIATRSAAGRLAGRTENRRRSRRPLAEERNRRFPVSGAALTADGTLLLIAVDGRDPSLSIGLTRPEFGACCAASAHSDGMAFDSGGSATLVARRLGEHGPERRQRALRRQRTSRRGWLVRRTAMRR